MDYVVIGLLLNSFWEFFTVILRYIIDYSYLMALKPRQKAAWRAWQKNPVGTICGQAEWKGQKESKETGRSVAALFICST